MAPRAKTTTPVDPVEAAAKRATIPTRPVIEHTKLFRAELQVQMAAVNCALDQVEHTLATAAGERDAAIEAADGAYDLAMAAAGKTRKGAVELASQRFDAIRANLDKEQADLRHKKDGIEAALERTAEPKAETRSEPDNVVPIAAE